MMTLIHPLLAANAFQFAIEKATPSDPRRFEVLVCEFLWLAAHQQ